LEEEDDAEVTAGDFTVIIWYDIVDYADIHPYAASDLLHLLHRLHMAIGCPAWAPTTISGI
jgi:hypothetical protein